MKLFLKLPSLMIQHLHTAPNTLVPIPDTQGNSHLRREFTFITWIFKSSIFFFGSVYKEPVSNKLDPVTKIL